MNAVIISAVPLVTDEQLAHLAPWLPLLMVALLLLAFFWTDRGVPWVADEDEDPAAAPPTAPELSSIEAPRRASDRG